MSNHDDPWRKFVQTFFLAEQPNGYFVLNDIFRFLKEETLEGDGTDEDVHEPNTVLEPVPVAQTVVSAPEPTYEPPRESTPPPALVIESSVPAAAVVADEAPTTDISESHVTQTPTPAPEEPPLAAAPAAQPNGIHTPEPGKSAPVIVAPDLSPVSTPAPIQSTLASATISLPTPAAASAPPVIHSQPAAAPAAAPPAPRSWASLAASNPKKWGAAVNQESRGTTEILSNPVLATNGVPAQAVQSVPATNSSSQHHHQHQHHQHQHQHQHQQQRGGGGQHGGQGGGNGPRHDSPALAAAQSVSHAQCFVKVSFHFSFLFFLFTHPPSLIPIRAWSMLSPKPSSKQPYHPVSVP
jgi:hypothetical protein